MFGQVLDKLDTWLGRSFLFAYYIPCLLFAVLNLLLACIEWPRFREFVADEYAGAASTKAVDLLVALLAIAVIAYAISPLTQLITILLEGQRLPAWVTEPLLLIRAQKREELLSRSSVLQIRRVRLPRTADVIERLKMYRAGGATLKRITDPASIDRAEAAIEKLRQHRLLNRAVDTGLFTAAVGALEEALQRNCAELVALKPPVDQPDAEQAWRLDALHEEMFQTLVPYVIDIAQETEARQLDEQSRHFAETELAPTRLGNDAAQLRGYCQSRYGFEFDFFWPRLTLVIQKNDKLRTAIVNAKIQVDFSILSLTLTALTGVFWLVLLMFAGNSLWTLLAIAISVPPMIYALLGLVHASYTAFSELVRSSVDITRLDLLQALHLPLPETAEAERQLWETVARRLRLNERGTDLPFVHPA